MSWTNARPDPSAGAVGEAGQAAGRVALFVTCLVDNYCPEVGQAAVAVLERHGVVVDFPPAQTCCGRPAYDAGFLEDAVVQARRHARIFAAYDAVVCLSSACAALVRNHYPELLPDDPAVTALATRTYEFSQFLTDVLGQTDIGGVCAGSVAYHDACHQLRSLQVKEGPRELLSHLAEARLVELDSVEDCCGFGGPFMLEYPGMAANIAARKARSIERSGAATLVTCDVGCLLHLRAALLQRRSRCAVRHLAEVLAANA